MITIDKGRIARPLYLSLVGLLGATLLLSLIDGMQPYTQWLTSPVALFIGLLFALIWGCPVPRINRWGSKALLQFSVVALGFGMNVNESLASGREGMLVTIVTVFGTLLLGWLIGHKGLRLDRETTALISSGTAICGGSAIAAVGPVIKANNDQMSVSLGVVFLLNALALFLFPAIGRHLGLDQGQFGTWAALAIHDTSSVVGAGSAYGSEALEIATTIKLMRALWIVPVTLLFSLLQGDAAAARKVRVPLFIILFIVAILINTYLLEGHAPEVGSFIALLGRKGLTLSLFFIGASLSLNVIRSVGTKALLLGVSLWIIASLVSLLIVLF